MHSLRIISENTSLVLITIFLLIIVTLPATIMTTSTINRVYGQLDQLDLDAADSSTNIQNTTEKIVQVGDIDIAYKMLGKGDPILLISGGSADKNA